MDFVFFAFSSLSVGFIVLLLSLVSGRTSRILAWRYLVASLIAGLLYYTLLVSVARDQLSTYYLFTLSPHVLLFFLTIVVFKKKRDQGST